MLELTSRRQSSNCEGASRRDFLKVGTLGLSAMSLPALLQARAAASASGKPVKETSVVWLWLSGGPTHVETFDPKLTAPSEYRSTTGEVATGIPGVTIGGTLPQIASANPDLFADTELPAHTIDLTPAG